MKPTLHLSTPAASCGVGGRRIKRSVGSLRRVAAHAFPLRMSWRRVHSLMNAECC